jgi:hypothetical protein
MDRHNREREQCPLLETLKNQKKQVTRGCREVGGKQLASDGDEVRMIGLLRRVIHRPSHLRLYLVRRQHLRHLPTCGYHRQAIRLI